MSRIALVDDDRNILTSVSMTLEAEGFEVETYNDGQQALDVFAKRLPDMAVFDIKMPRMDGMDLLQRVRQNSTMPIIFLTSKRSGETKTARPFCWWVQKASSVPTLSSRSISSARSDLSMS